MVKGFHSLGFGIHIFSYSKTFAPWTNENISVLENNWVSSVKLYKFTINESLQRKLMHIMYSKIMHNGIPPFSKFHTPLGMRSWFTRQVEIIDPDLIMINYAQFDGILDHNHFKSTRRVIDTIDLHSLNLKMQNSLRSLLPPPPIHPDQVEIKILQEKFYENTSGIINHREFQVFDQYSNTIAIAEKEADIIRENTHTTIVNFLPMMHEIPKVTNSYAGSALFPTGPNLFNTQGYLYFARRVLPLIIRNQPDFSLQVTGFLDQNQIVPVPGIIILGFVPDLTSLFEESCFVISPVFGGTGQQIKIIEAMAYGLPVIALRDAAERSPLIHEVNGLVAQDANEFAEHVIRLWTDRVLCKKYGQAARVTIQNKYSQLHLNEELSKLLSRAYTEGNNYESQS